MRRAKAVPRPDIEIMKQCLEQTTSGDWTHVRFVPTDPETGKPWGYGVEGIHGLRKDPERVPLIAFFPLKCVDLDVNGGLAPELDEEDEANLFLFLHAHEWLSSCLAYIEWLQKDQGGPGETQT